MDASVILAVIGSLISVIAAIVSFSQFGARRNAEKKYIEILSHQKKKLEQILLEQQSDGRSNKIGTDDFEQLLVALREYSESLPKEEKMLVRNSLLQNSEIGRLRYAKKLLHEIGVHGEQEPLTKP